MSSHILKCRKCGIYTMKESCEKCGEKAQTTKPAKYSPLDLHGDYRRKYKKDELKF